MVAVFTKPPKVTKKERKKKKRRFCDCYSFYWILIFLIIWKWQFSNQGTTKHQVLIRADTWNFNWFSSTNCLMISKCLPKIYTGRLASIYWGWMKQNSRSTTLWMFHCSDECSLHNQVETIFYKFFVFTCYALMNLLMMIFQLFL